MLNQIFIFLFFISLITNLLCQTTTTTTCSSPDQQPKTDNENMYELEVIRYGEDEDQFFRLMSPMLTPDSPPLAHGRPVAFLVHGGFWKQQYNIDNGLLDKVAPSLCDHGFAVVLLEYRRGRPELDGGRGGWPNSNLDVALALQKLDSLVHSSDEGKYKTLLNLNKVVLIGHSAGGTFVFWPCCEHTDMFGIKLSFTPALCVGSAPIGDLVHGFERQLSDEKVAVLNYMGSSPSYVNDVDTVRNSGVDVTSEHAVLQDGSPYKLASPSYLLPIKTKSVMIAGTKDVDVPVDIVTAFYEQAKKASEGTTYPEPDLIVIEDADHYDLVDPSHNAWQTTLNYILSFIR